MKDKKIGLGKGLSALLGEEVSLDRSGFTGDEADRIEYVSIDLLRAGPFQPRRNFSKDSLQDLINSISQKGVLQPLLVRRCPDDTENFEIIAGERRYRASLQAGLTEVPVLIKDFSDKDSLEVALIENLQRENLNPLEEAQAYARLMKEFAHTQEQLAKVVGKSRSHIANMIRLLDLPEEIKEEVVKGNLSAGHARALLSAPDAVELAQKVIQKGLNVRQTEKLVQEKLSPKEKKTRGTRLKVVPSQDKPTDILSLEEDLSRVLKTPVLISWEGKAGDLIIHFENVEHLDELLQKIMKM